MNRWHSQQKATNIMKNFKTNTNVSKLTTTNLVGGNEMIKVSKSNDRMSEVVEITGAPSYLVDLDELFYRVEQEDKVAIEKLNKITRVTPMLYSKSIYWIKNLARKGYMVAQHDLGIAYRQGFCVKRNEAEALKWFKLSAEQGYARAQFYVAAAYKYGHGVEIDFQEAAKWLELASAQNHTLAITDLAASYLVGHVVKQSD